MALSGMPTGHQPESYAVSPVGQAQARDSTAAVAQLFARMSQEIEEHKPKNCIHFIVDFLCKHYPEHLHGFASIWQMDPDLESERHEVVNFFKAHKISTAVAAHFTNAGYDTLDTLTTLSPDSLVDVEAFNNVKWLPGHKVRLQQIFGEISARVRAYKQQFPSSHGARHKPQHRRAASPSGHAAAAHHGSGAHVGAGHHAHGAHAATGHGATGVSPQGHHQISSYAHHSPSPAQAHHSLPHGSAAASLAHASQLTAGHTALAAHSLAAHASSIPPYMGNNPSSLLPSAGPGLGHGLNPTPSLTPPSLPQPGGLYMPSPYQVS